MEADHMRSNSIHIQDGLRAGVSLDYYQKRYGISSKRHGSYPDLVQFKYSMIDSPLEHPLVQQCRGLILDEASDWAVVARPFDKFFNYGESHAAPIDWSTARVQEKLDGSLIILYHFHGMWRMATSGTPDGFGLVEGHPSGLSYRDFFWRTFEAQGLRVPDSTWIGYTFMFELTSQYNRIVVRHLAPSLKLIGVRHKDGTELSVDGFENHFPVVKSFPLTSMDEILETFKTMDPLAQEGYVIVDAGFNRVKVKHPGYITLHHMRGNGFSNKRALQILRSGESDEVLAAFPEWQADFSAVKTRYTTLSWIIYQDWNRFKQIPIQKDFALAVKDFPYAGILFSLRKGHITSVREGLNALHLDKLMDLMEI